MTQDTILFAPTDADGARPGELGVVERYFARHETFHPRYGWLKKGYDAAAGDHAVFQRKDAPVVLGVGKNMVRAIRYWSIAVKVLEEYPDPKRPRAKLVKPSEIGEQLLADDGWDPYLEHPGSLWLLHWLLLRPVSKVPAWYYAFNLLRSLEFTDLELVEELKVFRDAHTGWGRVVDSSLKRDADCMIRMYAAGSNRARYEEDGLDSPFSELGLLAPTAGDRRHVRFNLGPKETLPHTVVAYASLDYLSLVGHEATTISLRRLTHDEASPGRVFKLTETALRASLDRYAESTDGIQLADPAGVAQMSVTAPPAALAGEALQATYTSPAHS